MRIEVRGRGFEVTSALSRYTERRLLFALARFSSRITVIRAHLHDVNGPRGGVDKQCQLAAVVAAVGEVRILEAGENIHAAIERAADRLARTVAREMARRRERPRLARRLVGF